LLRGTTLFSTASWHLLTEITRTAEFRSPFSVLKESISDSTADNSFEDSIGTLILNALVKSKTHKDEA
jgi:hypothetical protein